VSFHRALLKVADEVAICSFEELVEDPSIVVERANEKFGSRFRAWALGETEQAQLRDQIEREHRRAGLPESRLTIPSGQKLADKLRIRRDVEGHRLLGQARALTTLCWRGPPKMPAPETKGHLPHESARWCAMPKYCPG
jgi:hypothetical protein